MDYLLSNVRGFTDAGSVRGFWIVGRKQRPARLVVHFLLEGVILANRTRSCHRRPRVDGAVPASDIWERGERRFVARQHARGSLQPPPRGNVRDRELFPDDEFPSFQMGI